MNEQGSQQVQLGESTTYTITATGNGGRAESSARVTVSIPPVAAVPPEDLDNLFKEAVKDAFFDYNNAEIRPDAKESLVKDAVS